VSCRCELQGSARFQVSGAGARRRMHLKHASHVVCKTQRLNVLDPADTCTPIILKLIMHLALAASYGIPIALSTSLGPKTCC
jgi:hypothetical protein